MSSVQDEHGADFLSGGGELGRLIRSFDWAKTPLGPIDSWSAPLVTTVGLILGSNVPLITLWGDQGTMIYNDAYARFAGGRHPGLLGLPVREGWPEVSGFNDRVMKMVLAGGTLTYRDQEMRLSRSGEPEQVWLNLDYSPVLDGAGEPIGVIAIVVETTARILAERELRQEEAQREAERERLRRTLDQAPSIVTVLRGPDHIVDFVNEAHRKLFDSADWIGRPAREAIPSIAGQGFFEILDSVYATGRTMEVDSAPIAFQRAPDGQLDRRYLTLMFAPAFDDDGKTEGVFVLGFDVTEGAIGRRRSATLARLAERIADADGPDMLAQAAAEVLAIELKATRAGYAFIDEAAGTIEIMRDWTAPGLESLAGPMPIDAVGPSLEKLRSGTVAAIPDVHLAPGAGRRADWLDRLRIRSVLNVPVTEHGRLVAMVYVNDSVVRSWDNEEIELARQVAERTRQAVERLRAEADLARARQAEAIGRVSGELVHELNNLLMAVSSSLELLRKRLPESPQLLRLVDGATEGVRRGDDLTRRLLQAGRSDTQPAPREEAPPPAIPVGAGEARALSILAVDDDALVLMNTVAMLEDLGHEVTAAYSAREALDALGQQDFDLVVTDHAMPQMTGAQLASEIHGQQPAMPVVLATGYAEPPAGLDQRLPLLTKPFSLADLRAALTRAMAWRSGVA